MIFMAALSESRKMPMQAVSVLRDLISRTAKLRQHMLLRELAVQ
jgi:hypothetical protein